MVAGHHHDHDDGRVYDEVPLDEMEWDEDDEMYYYQCPCGDMFELSKVCILLRLCARGRANTLRFASLI